MEQYDDLNQNENETGNQKSHFYRDTGGIIPITANIFNESQVTKDETVEYQGIPIMDITAVGFVVNYKELENKIILTIFDYTGIMDVVFSEKMDTQDNTGLNTFHYDGTKKPIQIFGTIKVYKNEKKIQGAKIMPITSSFVLYHRADVIHAWLYLTGKLQELKEAKEQNIQEEAKMIAIGNSNKNNMINEAISLLDNFAKRGKNEINEKEIMNLFKKFGNKSKEIIRTLIDDSKLVDNDGVYEIM